MVNRVTLIGRLGKDPEFRTTAGGTPMAKFTLATSERRKDASGQYVETTEWHRLTVWGRLAEVARDYLTKGSLLYVEGRIHYGSFENKDGQKVYTTEIHVAAFQMLGSKGESLGGGQPQERHSPTELYGTTGPGAGGQARQDTLPLNTGGYRDDDLPF